MTEAATNTQDDGRDAAPLDGLEHDAEDSHGELLFGGQRGAADVCFCVRVCV